VAANGVGAPEQLTSDAHVLRWEKDLGTLEAGKFADFVVLSANPLDNISHIRKVEAVYKDGKRV